MPTADATSTLTDDAVVFDAAGGAVVPGFVDPHTHVVFAGDRRDELRLRLTGASYAEIAAGWRRHRQHASMATRAASDEQLAADTRRRLDEMLRCGTTTCEAKSGYALTTEGELKMLRTVRALATDAPDRDVADLHGRARGARGVSRSAPRVRRSGRERDDSGGRARTAAESCDVFCETGVFTPEESREILEAGRAAGLAPRIHADELAASGGSAVAAEVGALFRGSFDLRRRGRRRRPGGRRGRRDAAANRVLLSQARTLRAGADAHRPAASPWPSRPTSTLAPAIRRPCPLR